MCAVSSKTFSIFYKRLKYEFVDWKQYGNKFMFSFNYILHCTHHFCVTLFTT